MQEKHNSIANALELHFSCTNPSIYCINLEKSKQTNMKQREQLTSASECAMIHPLLMGSAAAHFFWRNLVKLKAEMMLLQ